MGAHRKGSRSHLHLLALVCAALIPAALTVSAYWPGLMNWDPVVQYGEALSGKITDWHPPIMQWLWQRIIPWWPGPVPMLLLQVGLWWGGLLLLAARALRKGRPVLAWALLACGLLPIGLALTGMIYKDSLMAGALITAAGIVSNLDGRRRLLLRIVAAVLLCFAAALRFNGFAAAMPLMVMLLPQALRRTPLRLGVTAAVTSAALLALVPAINHEIGAKSSGVELSLILFDLGGITEQSGVSVFPEEFEVKDPVAVNHKCYEADKWDSYSDWVDVECAIGFTTWRDDVAPEGISPAKTWLSAIVHHPIAYAEHRLHHFAINIRLLPLDDDAERPVPNEDAPNAWNFHITPNPRFYALDNLAVWSAHTPLGWPVVLMALALGAAIAGRGLKDARVIMPIALSSLLYGMSYLVVSVASELRYHLWTDLAALVVTTMVLAEWRNIPKLRLVVAYVPATLITVTAFLLR